MRGKSGSRPARERGMTLIELMISMTIGLVVLALTSYAYLANKRSWMFNEQDARLQDRGRYILNMLTGDIRLAGYMGCKSIASSAPVPSLPNIPKLDALLVNGVGITNGAGSAKTTTELNLFGPIPGGNFQLTTKLAKDGTSATTAAITPDQSSDSAWGSTAHVSFVLIDDCGSAQFVEATPTAAGVINMSAGAKANAEYAAGTTVNWYDWSSANGQGGTVYTYANNELRRNGQLLANNVELFRVCIGVDTDKDNKIDETRFANWDATALHGNEIPLTIHVNLVLASPPGQRVQDQAVQPTYSVCGPNGSGYWQPSGTSDDSAHAYRLRRLFSTSVTLRNRVR
ncbi:MAG: PilW family protein [Azoarcus sp.]|jgi:type IV pilus assembly protein PilW|nr:PilW family protein [Azoarcus sp.]